MKDVKEIKGTEITGVHQHYENLGIHLADGSYVYMTYPQLLIILNEFDFQAEKKKTRTWLTVKIDNWRVERQDEPRNY